MAVNNIQQHRYSLKLRVLTKGARVLASATVAHDSAQLLQPSHVFPTKTEAGIKQISLANHLSPLQQSEETSLHTDLAVSVYHYF